MTGVGAAHRPANPGSHSVDQTRTVNPQDLDGLPAYQAYEENNSDAPPMLLEDVHMNDGLPVQSIEDEGIDLGFSGLPSYKGLTGVGLQNSAIHSTWDFSALNSNRNKNFISGTGSEIDGDESPLDGLDVDGSDVVQDASSASSGSRRGRLEDFDHAIAEDDDGIFVDDNPVPDMDPNQLDPLMLHRDLLQRGAGTTRQPEFKVLVPTEDEIEEPATEIHVEEGEGIKLD